MKFFLFFFWLINSLVSIVPIIIAVAFFTLAERKLMAYLQRRIGPNVVGPLGLLQPIADAIKLLLKESLFTKASTPYLYTLACTFPFIFGFSNWFNIPTNETSDLSNTSSINFLYIFPISLGGLAGVILAGWASGSKYATIGSFRGLSQLISYDIPMIFSILPLLFFSGSLDFIDIILNQLLNVWFIFGAIVSFLIFGITVLAETNRVPFDLPEAEAELVAGFNVEYSSINFALFFLGEYSNMLLLAVVGVMLFIAGHSFINFDIITIIIIFITVLYLLTNNFLYFIEDLYNTLNVRLYTLNKDIHILLKTYQFIIKISLYTTILFFILITYYSSIFIILEYIFDSSIFNFFSYIITKVPFSSKIIILSFLFILVRANVPRYRFDQLLSISWKTLVPISISSLLNSFLVLFSFNGFLTLF